MFRSSYVVVVYQTLEFDSCLSINQICTQRERTKQNINMLQHCELQVT
jgi:hypothetical protein